MNVRVKEEQLEKHVQKVLLDHKAQWHTLVPETVHALFDFACVQRLEGNYDAAAEDYCNPELGNLYPRNVLTLDKETCRVDDKRFLEGADDQSESLLAHLAGEGAAELAPALERQRGREEAINTPF